MPVANCLGSGFVGINGHQLRQGNRHGPVVPKNQRQHVGGTGVFRCHALDFDGFPFPERRDDFGSDALGLKRESDFVIKVAIPPHDLLFRPIGVCDDVVVDSVLPGFAWYALRLLCCWCLGYVARRISRLGPAQAHLRAASAQRILGAFSSVDKLARLRY